MFSMEFELVVVIILSAITCSIPGAFLVMRKNYYAADTANRSAMLGIAVALIFSSFLSSPLVIILGSFSAALCMYLILQIKKFTNLRAKGISIIISSAFLCFGILLASNVSLDNAVHFDLSIIYLGETAFTSFNRLRIAGIDIGSYAFYSILIVMIINIIIVVIYYKEFKLDGIDKNYAASIEINSEKIDFILVLMTALSVSVSFQTAGIFMTTAFILGPAAAALFYAKRLSTLALVSVFISSIACYIGFNVAWPAEISISGAIVSFIGIVFILSVIFAPEEGIIKKYFDKLTLRKKLDEYIILDILSNQSVNTAPAALVEKLAGSLNWKVLKVSYIVNKLKADKLLEEVNGNIYLTKEGRSEIEKFMKAQNCFH